MLIHDRYGFAVTVVALVGAVGAIISLIRPQILPALRIYIRATIAVVALQVLIGLVLVATGKHPHELIHWFYGAATLLTLPLAVSIGRTVRGREQHIWLVGGALLTMLFALRAMGTG